MFSQLDVGCGRNKRGDIGIDRNKHEAVDIVADAHYLPFRDNVFEKVISFCVLEHSFNPSIFLKEQHRVLRSGGQIVCVTDNSQYFQWSVLSSKWGGMKQSDYFEDHYSVFYPENVVRLLKHVGFGVNSCKYIGKKASGGWARILHAFARLMTSLDLWRKECLFWRFEVRANK
jgi:ubiquinone/menaquinone biosynthesis C-methylase UbiE